MICELVWFDIPQISLIVAIQFEPLRGKNGEFKFKTVLLYEGFWWFWTHSSFKIKLINVYPNKYVYKDILQGKKMLYHLTTSLFCFNFCSFFLLS